MGEKDAARDPQTDRKHANTWNAHNLAWIDLGDISFLFTVNSDGEKLFF